MYLKPYEWFHIFQNQRLKKTRLNPLKKNIQNLKKINTFSVEVSTVLKLFAQRFFLLFTLYVLSEMLFVEKDNAEGQSRDFLGKNLL